VTGNEAYGGNPGLRERLEEEEIPYVLAVACNALVETKAGAKRADALAALVPAQAWQRLSCADGSKGPRLYDWALIAADSGRRWLLARRSLPRRNRRDLAGLLPLLLAAAGHARRACRRGGRALGSGGLLRGGEARPPEPEQRLHIAWSTPA